MSKKLMNGVRLFTLAALLTTVPASDAFACSCYAIGPPCQNAFKVDAVFAGQKAGREGGFSNDLPPGYTGCLVSHSD
jgi:hypothetical protein